MICPKCGNSDIRRSHSFDWGDWLHRALGREAYRCRKCRLRFFRLRSTQIAGHSKKTPSFSSKGEKRLDFRRRKRLIRRIITVAVFVVMFSMFGLFLIHVSVDHPPPVQDAGPSDQ